jgi:hypothetical protein
MKLFLKFLMVVVLTCSAVDSFSQRRRAEILQTPKASGYGNVVTVEDDKIVGKVTFNDDGGFVTVEKDGESRTFTPKNIVSFEFNDMAIQRERRFFVFDYENKETGKTAPAFFEILKEFKTFALLSMIERIGTEVHSGLGSAATPALKSSNSLMAATQYETIFFMNNKGELEPYVQIREKEVQRELIDTNGTRKRIVDNDLVEKYTGIFYDQIKSFARENDLKFNVKEDLIRIFGKYEELIEN